MLPLRQRDRTVTSRLAQVAAWLLLAVVAVVTLSPAGWRPVTAIPANLERFAAFAVVGLAFSLVYPRRLWLVASMVLGAALAFESLQFLIEGRHPALRDVIAKLAGGGAGVAAGWAVSAVQRRRAATDSSD